jgi:hypothetical protein
MYAVTITLEDGPAVVPYPAGDSLTFLQGCVGGYVEVIDFDVMDFSASLWLNEEGKLEGLDYNALATDLVRGQIMPHDYIAGDVVITGLPDEEGYTTGLTLLQAEWLIGYLTF